MGKLMKINPRPPQTLIASQLTSERSADLGSVHATALSHFSLWGAHSGGPIRGAAAVLAWHGFTFLQNWLMLDRTQYKVYLKREVPYTGVKADTAASCAGTVFSCNTHVQDLDGEEPSSLPEEAGRGDSDRSVTGMCEELSQVEIYPALQTPDRGTPDYAWEFVQGLTKTAFLGVKNPCREEMSCCYLISVFEDKLKGANSCLIPEAVYSSQTNIKHSLYLPDSGAHLCLFLPEMSGYSCLMRDAYRSPEVPVLTKPHGDGVIEPGVGK
ncbi:hypothetical protein E1301_Tti019860 [Triplophysa tibetana]|uniref:Uncharacterized protein n=1 Tax=Triplophysa tibetana TaxID=1572043 RepID=A0A5A9NLH7_9TELE|nr:hypothetical protein E1301_Tti019860 [Triplophysa tibetana]